MTLKGAQSPVRFRKSDGIAFIIRVPDNLIDPMSVISVFRFKVKKKMRIAEYASVGNLRQTGRATRWNGSPSSRAGSEAAPTSSS